VPPGRSWISRMRPPIGVIHRSRLLTRKIQTEEFLRYRYDHDKRTRFFPIRRMPIVSSTSLNFVFLCGRLSSANYGNLKAVCVRSRYGPTIWPYCVSTLIAGHRKAAVCPVLAGKDFSLISGRKMRAFLKILGEIPPDACMHRGIVVDG